MTSSAATLALSLRVEGYVCVAGRGGASTVQGSTGEKACVARWAFVV